MVRIIRGPCLKCRGTLGQERDGKAVRVFCVNCGDDRWIEPVLRVEVGPEGVQRSYEIQEVEA